MRRKDREVTKADEIVKFLEKEQILRIAFYDEGEIYIVPVNYGYFYSEKHTFYFHGAKAGRKYELSQKKPLVGFEIDGKYELLTGEQAWDHSAAFQSVIGTGKVSVIDNPTEKIHGLNMIMRQTTSKADWNYNEEMLNMVAVFRLDVDKLSCKAK